MRTKYFLIGALTVTSLGFTDIAKALVDNPFMMNKYAQYREMVEETKGTIAPESDFFRHESKYARELAERRDLSGGIGIRESTLIIQGDEVPKNYKNRF